MIFGAVMKVNVCNDLFSQFTTVSFLKAKRLD